MNKFVIIDPNGVEKEIFIIREVPLDGSIYLIYTEEELTDAYNIVNFAKIVEENEKIFLDNITMEEEVKLKGVFNEEFIEYEK